MHVAFALSLGPALRLAYSWPAPRVDTIDTQGVLFTGLCRGRAYLLSVETAHGLVVSHAASCGPPGDTERCDGWTVSSLIRGEV
jgi:hypothetical protein